MYSNNFKEIRFGLINYIGASLSSVELSMTDSAKHIVVAMLIEEAINLSTDINGEINISDVKPLIKGFNTVVEERIKQLDNLGASKDLPAYKDYLECKKRTDSILERMRVRE